MTMEGMYTFHQDRSRNQRRVLWRVSICVAALVVLDIFSGGMIRASVRSVLAPIERAGYALGMTTNIIPFFELRTTLLDRQHDLEQQIADLTVQNALLKQQQFETMSQNIATTSVSNTEERAQVLSDPYTSPYGEIMIGVGPDQNVHAGDVVVDSRGVVLGTISTVGSQSATVSLMSAPGRTTDAEVHGVPITLTGRGGVTLYATLPRGTNVAVGDPVIVPQYHRRLIGVVVLVDAQASGADVPIVVGMPTNTAVTPYVTVVPHVL